MAKTQPDAPETQTVERVKTIPTPPTSPKTPPTPRISFATNDAGKIDVDSLRGESRDRLKSILSDSSLRAKLGLGDQGAPVGGNSAELATLFIETISLLAVQTARAFGHDPSVAQLLSLSDVEKRTILPALAPVIEKYGGSFGPYEKEIALVVVLVSIGAPKYMAMKRASLVIDHPPTSAGVQ